MPEEEVMDDIELEDDMGEEPMMDKEPMPEDDMGMGGGEIVISIADNPSLEGVTEGDTLSVVSVGDDGMVTLALGSPVEESLEPGTGETAILEEF